MPHDHDHYPVTITLPQSLSEALIYALTTATARRPPDPRIDTILATVKRIETMSGQALTDLAAQKAVIDDLGVSFTTFVTNNDATIQALKDQITAGGGTVDPAIDAAITANTQALQTTVDALHAKLGTAPAP